MQMRSMLGIWPAILEEKVMSHIYWFSKFILARNIFCKGERVERQ
jgi:hypothetical protein